MMKQLLDQIADSFLKDGMPLSGSENAKALVFINTCFFSSVLLFIASINRFLITDTIPYLAITLCVVLILLPYLIKYSGNYRRYSISLPLVAIIATPFLTYIRGGIGSSQAMLFILIPILSFYFTGSKRGAALSLSGIVMLLVFLYLDLNGHTYPYPILKDKTVIVHSGITLISIFVLISYITWHYEKLNNESQQELIRSENRAKLANKTKDVFWANISHEIRTPLNGILGMTNLVLDSRINNEQRELLDIIKDSAENLNIILSDVIDYSKIETNELEIVKRPFNLKHTLDEVTHLFFHMANEKGIKLTYSIDSDVPQGILTDENRLKQVLINLVANAIKFTDHGFVKVIVEKSAKKDTLNFIVEDSGIGIEEKKMERLFRPFSQIDDGRTRKYGGTGLGLVICKRILDLIGGDIKVESKVGSGSIFTFSLKALQVKLAPHHGEYRSDSAGHLSKTINLNVLIAEDNGVNRKLLISLLNKNHIYPDIATNGVEAFEMSKEKKYDLIFMDIQMPIMDGITSSKNIISYHKENKINHRPAIIAVTANVLQEDRERCFEAGMDDFMAKPINNNILVSVIERYSHQVLSESMIGKGLKDKMMGLQSKVENRLSPNELIHAKLEQRRNHKNYNSFDLEALLNHFSEDLYIIENMFDQFFNKYNEDISMLQESIDLKDYQSLALKAHSLKGTFTTLFCYKGREKCMELELLGKRENLIGAQKILKEIRDICESLIIDYQDFSNHQGII